MLDARNVYRKVTRTICDFSPEQLQNLTAIVWLHRGQQDRFLGLVKSYLERVCSESGKVRGALAPFEATLSELRGRFEALGKAAATVSGMPADGKKALADGPQELRAAVLAYEGDARKPFAGLGAFGRKWAGEPPRKNEVQHEARRQFEPSAEAIRELVKQVDLLYKLAARVAELGGELAGEGALCDCYDRRAAGRLVKQLEAERRGAVEQMKKAVYFHRQAAWLQDRFPGAELAAVPGLVKLVDRKEIEAADWSLTPGRYVGVVPPEEDEDFDFEQAMRDLRVELAVLDAEAVELAARIQTGLGELL